VRILRPAFQKMRVLSAADSVAHWRMNEASGSTLADETGQSPLTATSGGNIVIAPHLSDNGGPAYGRARLNTD
jgi:hypothetical protein